MLNQHNTKKMLHVVNPFYKRSRLCGCICLMFTLLACSLTAADTGVTSSILTVQAQEGTAGFYTVGATMILVR